MLAATVVDGARRTVHSLKAPLIAAVVALAALVALAAWIGAPGASRGVAVLERADEPEPATRPSEPAIAAIDDPAAPSERVEVETASSDALEPADASAPGAPAESPRAVARGTLVDARTGEPLPSYEMQLVDAHGLAVLVTTDDDGHFVAPRSLAAGDLVAQFHDRPGGRRGEPQRVELALDEHGDPLPLALAVASGPTFHLALLPSDGPSTKILRARLRLFGPNGDARTDFEPLRAGETPWVRFAPLSDGADEILALEVRSRDGLWTGEGRAQALLGVAPGRVQVVLEQRAVLTGRVIDLEGAPVESASIELVVASIVGGAQKRTATTKSDGAFRFELLRAGPATLTVRSLRHVDAHVDFALEAGASHAEEVTLAPKPAVGSISGFVESETGTFEEKIDVRLRSTESASRGLELVQPVRWETRGGRRVGLFEFAALPFASYVVEVREWDWFAWESKSVRVEPPRAGVVFRVHDAGPSADLVVVARDVRTGKRVDRFHVTFEGQLETASFDATSDRILLPLYPLDLRLSWRIDCAGFQTQYGTLASFDRESIENGRTKHTAEIDLVPGWAERFRLLQRGPNRPIAEATVIVDGVEVGRTNAQGYFLLRAARKPNAVTFAYKDWRMDGKVDLRPASQRNYPMAQRAWMRAPPSKR